MTIIWCMIPEISSMTDRFFCHFGPFFALLPLKQPKKSKFYKNEKIIWKYYHFTHVYHKWHSYMVPEIWSFSSFCAIFCTFSPLKTWKIKIKKKEKNLGDIITLQNCTKNHNHMLHCCWDMAHDECNCYFSFWAIFYLPP